MNTAHHSGTSQNDDPALRTLYQQMLTGWNERDGAAMAAAFAEDGEVIGFDGSQMMGRREITTTLTAIFADHQTAAYVSKVRSIRWLSTETAILRAVVGMVPPGQSSLNPAANAHQTIVAAKHNGTWQIVLFQNTPAQFHGRPDLAAQLTQELQQLL